MAATRKSDGRFRKGVSGNPAGKPKGTKHKATMLAEQLAAGDAEEIMQVVIAKAKAGDMGALKLILPRLWPAPRTPAIKIALPDTSTAKGLAEAVDRIIAGVAEGSLSPEQARDLSSLITARRAILETVVLAERIEALEQAVRATR